MPSDPQTRVLYVDDHDDTCEMLRILLALQGIEVTCVKSAVGAALLMKANRFDMFILDVWLPGLNGLAFCREIRTTDSQTPILFYSGAAYDVDKKKGLAAGADAYVTKPDIDGLIETVLVLLSKAKTSAVAVISSEARSVGRLVFSAVL